MFAAYSARIMRNDALEVDARALSRGKPRRDFRETNVKKEKRKKNAKVRVTRPHNVNYHKLIRRQIWEIYGLMRVQYVRRAMSL